MGQVYCTHVFLFSGGIWYMLYEKESESYTCKISISIATELEAFENGFCWGCSGFGPFKTTGWLDSGWTKRSKTM